MDTPLMKSTEQLFATIMEGDIKQIQRLIEEGLHVNLADEAGCTLVHLAAFNNKKEIVEFLLEEGANINAVDREQRTPLHYAISEGHEEMVKLLLEKGANIYDELDKFHWNEKDLVAYEERVMDLQKEAAILEQKLDEGKQEGIQISHETGRVEGRKEMDIEVAKTHSRPVSLLILELKLPAFL